MKKLVIIIMALVLGGCSGMRVNGVNPNNPTANKQTVNKGFWHWCQKNPKTCTVTLIAGGTVIGLGVKALSHSGGSSSTPATKSAPAPTEKGNHSRHGDGGSEG